MVRERPVPNSDEKVELKCPTTYKYAHFQNIFIAKKILKFAKTTKINITGNRCCRKPETESRLPYPPDPISVLELLGLRYTIFCVCCMLYILGVTPVHCALGALEVYVFRCCLRY